MIVFGSVLMPELMHMVCRHGFQRVPAIRIARLKTSDADHDDCEGCVSNTGRNQQLPEVQTTLSEHDVRDRLRTLSKRGKLPGFEASEADAVCSVAAHGSPFDAKLTLHLADDRLTFRLSLLRMMPGIFALLLIVAVWPGLPLTDSFLSSFDWYNGLMGSIGIKTWHWYLPLTILPAPFAFRSAIAKSRSSAHESALEQIEKIRAVL